MVENTICILNKITVFLIKYIPLVQLIANIITNTLYIFTDDYIIDYNLSFILGNSIITSFLLYIISYRFKFCNWHRILITGNLINLLLAYADAIFDIPISVLTYILIFYVICFITIILAIYSYIKHKNNE